MDTTTEDDELLLRATLLESLSYHNKMAAELQENIAIREAVDEFDATNPKDVMMDGPEVEVKVADPLPSTSKGEKDEVFNPRRIRPPRLGEVELHHGEVQTCGPHVFNKPDEPLKWHLPPAPPQQNPLTRW